ncbi:MAG: hypothetical protein LN417_04370 [Candidatus Thermoplasmatota archaeon]|nr:hypothetical protein [Candidatus Thermoplasmatota archaeon]
MSDWISLLVESLVAVGTLSLAVMVLLQMRESRKALARQIHAEQLRDFLEQWREAIERAYVEKHTIFRQRYTPSNVVESNPLFDDVKAHLHKESGLMESHSRYTKHWMKFRQAGYSLYERIRTDSCAKTDEKLTTGSETGLRDAFITTLNEQYLTYASKNEVEYKESVAHRIEGQTSTTGRRRVIFMGSGSEIAVVEDKSKASVVRDTHKQMLRDYTNSRYNDLAARLVETSSEINTEVENLYREIDELIAQPLFAGDCKYIQRSLAGGSRWRKLFKNRN